MLKVIGSCGMCAADVGWSEVDVTCDERNVSSVVICIINANTIYIASLQLLLELFLIVAISILMAVASSAIGRERMARHHR